MCRLILERKIWPSYRFLNALQTFRIVLWSSWRKLTQRTSKTATRSTYTSSSFVSFWFTVISQSSLPWSKEFSHSATQRRCRSRRTWSDSSKKCRRNLRALTLSSMISNTSSMRQKLRRLSSQAKMMKYIVIGARRRQRRTTLGLRRINLRVEVKWSLIEMRESLIHQQAHLKKILITLNNPKIKRWQRSKAMGTG